MKIVDVAEFYTDQGGGVKTYINQKLKAGAACGHEVVIIAPGAQAGEEERHGGRVLWVPGPPLPVDPRYYILWREKQVHALLDRERPDIVEGSSPWTGGWFAARWPGKSAKSFIFHQDPVAVYPHTFFARSLGYDRVDRLFTPYWRYLRRLSNRFDATVVSGNWLAERLKTFSIKHPVAIPFGIDKTFSSANRRDVQLRKKLLADLGLDEQATLFVSISRYHPEKRLGTLFKGFREAARHKPMGLLVFGDGPFRWMVSRMARGIPHLKLMGFTSRRESLADILASSDFFLHGSAAETYGLVVAEAVCSGVPVIVPNEGGAGELAAPEYAETYPAGDAQALTASILRMLDRDRTAMVRACDTAASKEIKTLDNHFDKLFELYKNLSNGRSVLPAMNNATSEIV